MAVFQSYLISFLSPRVGNASSDLPPKTNKATVTQRAEYVNIQQSITNIQNPSKSFIIGYSVLSVGYSFLQ